MTKKVFLVLSTVMIILIQAHIPTLGNETFESHFLNETLRVDYYHLGDSKLEIVTLHRLYRYKGWAGSTGKLIDKDQAGKYAVNVFDREGKVLLFRHNYNSIFEEYQTTDDALNGRKRTYQESVLIPFPKEPVLLTIESRDKNNKFHDVFRSVIDPENTHICRREKDRAVAIGTISGTDDPHRKVDLLLIAEGYCDKEQDKFNRDAARLAEIFLKTEPYSSLRDLFTIRTAFRASADNGCTEPDFGKFRYTALSCSFDALGSERYLLTENYWDVMDVACNATWDSTIIIANSSRYGGGGIFNFMATCTSDNQWTSYVFLHEFGHSFAGLADEYYTSKVEYNDFHPIDREPLAANITAMPDREKLKWKSLCEPGIELPTPWAKKEYDDHDRGYQKKRDQLYEQLQNAKRRNAPKEEIAQMELEQSELSRKTAQESDEILLSSPNYGKVGAFEGAGYRTEGLYRSMVDCIMFSKGQKPFCRVCREALKKRILFYCE